jgi:anti-sigma B factor antagonist
MIQTQTIDNITVVTFTDTDKVSALVTETLKEEINKILINNYTGLVINLEYIDYIDSSGFGMFLSIMKTAKNNGGEIKICNVKESVMDLFKLLHLHNVFEIYNSVEECVNSFK